jgi:hypothetical protein
MQSRSADASGVTAHALNSTEKGENRGEHGISPLRKTQFYPCDSYHTRKFMLLASV